MQPIHDRPLPKKPEVELSCISGMMQSDRYFWYCLEKLIADHFTIDAFKLLFNRMKENKLHDPVMVEQFLNNYPDCLFSIVDIFNAGFSVTGETEVNILIKLYKQREGATRCYNAANAYLGDEDANPDDISSKLITDISSLSIGTNNGYRRLSELLPAENERQRAVMSKKSAAFFKTGFKALDDLVCIAPSDYIVVGAYPSNGKSTLANTIGRYIAKNGGVVLVFNLDTANEVEVSRAVFTEARLNLNSFNLGFGSMSDFKKIENVYPKLSKMELYLDDNSSPTPSQIAAKAQRLKTVTGRLDLVIIDYFQNTKSDIKGNLRECFNHTSRALHDLYKVTGCPTMVLSQMARTNESDQRPTSNKLKETGNLYEDADKAILLHIPGHYKNLTTKDAEYNLLEVMVTKNKNGPIGNVKLNIDRGTGVITDRTESDEFYGEPSAYQNQGDF